jgi:hypothetical protein
MALAAWTSFGAYCRVTEWGATRCDSSVGQTLDVRQVTALSSTTQGAGD